ncbi:DUF5360 family protein [Kitasatospora sp. NPDC002040]|uniref:DUF5360 family protein n=1 Tax=Kitasatospora sp. NPDC002040 TaxID=3154661 RepID=UPI003322D010
MHATACADRVILRLTKASMAVTDIGFLLYWSVTLLALVPAQYAYKDYDNPVLSAWNYSFVPLDVAASVTGLAALRLSRRDGRAGRAGPSGRAGARPLMLVSLVLTSIAGLQAVAFWALRGDFTLSWWLPNLFLLLFPLPGAVLIIRQWAGRPRSDG